MSYRCLLKITKSFWFTYRSRKHVMKTTAWLYIDNINNTLSERCFVLQTITVFPFLHNQKNQNSSISDVSLSNQECLLYFDVLIYPGLQMHVNWCNQHCAYTSVYVSVCVPICQEFNLNYPLPVLISLFLASHCNFTLDNSETFV